MVWQTVHLRLNLKQILQNSKSEIGSELLSPILDSAAVNHFESTVSLSLCVKSISAIA
jgi:hypothetical protein